MGLFGPNIQKMQARGDVPGLIKVLGQSRDTRTQDAAAKALADIGDQAVLPLIAALTRTSPRLRFAASRILGQLGDRRAVEPLIAALYDRDMHVCEAAAQSLRAIGAPEASEALTAHDVVVRAVELAALTALQVGDLGPGGEHEPAG